MAQSSTAEGARRAIERSVIRRLARWGAGEVIEKMPAEMQRGVIGEIISEIIPGLAQFLPAGRSREFMEEFGDTFSRGGKSIPEIEKKELTELQAKSDFPANWEILYLEGKWP